MGKQVKRTSAKKSKKQVPARGVAHIHASFNNTIITVTTPSGDKVSSISCGYEHKNARKSTPHAAEEVARVLGTQLADWGMTEVSVRINGPGSGRESSIRGLAAGGLKILTIVDVTPNPHNGCRRKKAKRN